MTNKKKKEKTETMEKNSKSNSLKSKKDFKKIIPEKEKTMKNNNKNKNKESNLSLSNKKDLKKILPILQILRKIPANKLSLLLPHLDNHLTEIVCGCIYNALHNKELSHRTKKKLKKSLIKKKDDLRYVLQPNRSMLQKKKRLGQVGGSFGVILSAILPLIMSLL